MSVRNAFFTLVLLFTQINIYSEDLPVVAVMDFELEGISEADGNTYTDLFSYNIFETGQFLVIDRNERNKLQKGLGLSVENTADENEIREIAALLNADIIVSARIISTSENIHLEIKKLYVDKNRSSTVLTEQYSDSRQMTDDFRRLSRELFSDVPAGTEDKSALGKIAASLTPLRITERMLFVLPSGKLDADQAFFKLLLNRFSDFLIQKNNVSIYYMNNHGNGDRPLQDNNGDRVLQYYREEAEKNNYHSIVLIEEIEEIEEVDELEETAVLTIYERDLTKRTEIPFNPEKGLEEVFFVITSVLGGSTYYVPQEILLKEIRRNIKISRKLDKLIFAEEVAAARYSISLSSKLFTSVLAPEYHPNLNIASAAAGFYWYYDKLFGLAAEYEYSLGYPGTIDSKLSDHPLISQHQIRLIPFRLRTAGKLSLALSIFSSIHFHNAYEIVFAPGDVHFYNNETIIYFLTAGLNIGLVWNLSREWAVFAGIAELNYIYHRGPLPMDISKKRNFSGDFGGVGFIYRF